MSFGAGKQMGGPRLGWHSAALTWFWLLQPLALRGAVQKCLLLPDTAYMCLYAAVYLLDLIVRHHHHSRMLEVLIFLRNTVKCLDSPGRLIFWPFGTFGIQVACLWGMCNSNLSTFRDLPIALEDLD